MSDTLEPYGLQHTRLPCPLPSPGVCLNLGPSSRWCHPTISSSVIPFSSCLQSFPVSGSFQMRQFFTSGGQGIGTSASASVLSMNIHDWFPEWMDFRMDWLYFLAVQGILKSLLQHHSSKESILRCSVFFIVQHSHPYMTTVKTIALTRWTCVDKVVSLLFNMLSRLVIAFVVRSKRFLISWSPYAVILALSSVQFSCSVMSDSLLFPKCLIFYSYEAIWSWDFVFWEIFDHSFNFIACNCVVHNFYFFLVWSWMMELF